MDTMVWHGPPPYRRGYRILTGVLPAAFFLALATYGWFQIRSGDASLVQLIALAVVLVLGSVNAVLTWRRRRGGTRVEATREGLRIDGPAGPKRGVPWDRIDRLVVDDQAFRGVRPGLLSAVLIDGSRRFIGLPDGHEGLLGRWDETVRGGVPHRG